MTYYCLAIRSAAMFLVLFVCQLALVSATPFHKYPYVFLLDVGNEELEKTNTEQIRLSVPGGSLAVRYPAIETGDVISHIRVSGIDFGTELKANIIEGGPGYKYVVVVFMGNQGEPYDAVMTIQSISKDDIADDSGDVSSSSKYYEDDSNSDEVIISSNVIAPCEVDENVSAEDISDEIDASNENSQMTQQSSSVYTYVDSAADNEDDTSEEKDIHKQYSDSEFDTQEDSGANDDECDEDDQSNESEPSRSDDKAQDDDDDSDNSVDNSVDTKVYEKYQPVPIRAFGGGVKIYPQYAVPFALPDSNESTYYIPGDEVDSDHPPNDDDNGSDKYRDSNNNNFDSDETFAIAS